MSFVQDWFIPYCGIRRHIYPEYICRIEKKCCSETWTSWTWLRTCCARTWCRRFTLAPAYSFHNSLHEH
jgi:hypothetical protein